MHNICLLVLVVLESEVSASRFSFHDMPVATTTANAKSAIYSPDERIFGIDGRTAALG